MKSIKSTDFIIVKGFDKERNIIPIVIGGFFEPYKTNSRVACVWMLSTKYIKYNRYLMMKVLKSQIASASERYEIMYNFIYQSNTKAKNWLKRLGFKFDNPHPKNLKVPVGFEFFYKLHR